MAYPLASSRPIFCDRYLCSCRPLTGPFSFCALCYLPLLHTCHSPKFPRGQFNPLGVSLSKGLMSGIGAMCPSANLWGAAAARGGRMQSEPEVYHDTTPTNPIACTLCAPYRCWWTKWACPDGPWDVAEAHPWSLYKDPSWDAVLRQPSCHQLSPRTAAPMAAVPAWVRYNSRWDDNYKLGMVLLLDWCD